MKIFAQYEVYGDITDDCYKKLIDAGYFPAWLPGRSIHNYIGAEIPVKENNPMLFINISNRIYKNHIEPLLNQGIRFVGLRATRIINAD